ncbi:MAG TPA: extracellular solute-binding protein, partial [Chloroflexota bacterium]
MFGKRFSILAVLVVLTLLLASCGGSAATPTTAPPSGGTVAPSGGVTNTVAPSGAVTNTVAPSAAATDTVAPSSAVTNTVAPSGAMTGTTGTGANIGPVPSSPDQAPPVPNATKQYSGQTITYYGDVVGLGHQLDLAAVKQFTQDTGIIVKIVPKPQSSTENYATYQRFFQAKSPDVDVMMLDVIWPGAFGDNLLDLSTKLADQAKLNYPSIITNDTVKGKLVAMPWFGDFGMLYYRTDLLQKYGFSAPPKTWDELTQQATKIMAGEKASNANFAGFVFQGNAYEGLTCDALEWIASSGGGTIIENGKVTLNNPKAIAALNTAKAWIGTIAPRGVTSYQEEDARGVWNAGNAAFMRNWPYAYASTKTPDPKTGQASPIADKFNVAPLPHGNDPTDQSVGTVGGWQLGVSAYSQHPDAAVEFVRYLTSPVVTKWRAIAGTFVPLQPAVASDPDVLKAQPYLAPMANVTRVTRPS